MSKGTWLAVAAGAAILGVGAVAVAVWGLPGAQEAAAPAPAARVAAARPAADEVAFVAADGQVVADPSALAQADAEPQAKPDADWPLGDLGYGEYELGERYSFLVNQLSARGIVHRLEYDSSYAHKSLAIPQTALGASWELRLAFDQTAEKVFAMHLSHAAADTPSCERQFSAALDKMSAVAGFAPTLQKASTAEQPDRYRWQFRNGNHLELTRSCGSAPYAVAFRLEKGTSAGV